MKTTTPHKIPEARARAFLESFIYLIYSFIFERRPLKIPIKIKGIINHKIRVVEVLNIFKTIGLKALMRSLGKNIKTTLTTMPIKNMLRKNI